MTLHRFRARPWISALFAVLALLGASVSGSTAQLPQRSDDAPARQPDSRMTGTDMTGEVLVEVVAEHRLIVAMDRLENGARGDGVADQVVVFDSAEPLTIPSFSGLAILDAEPAGFTLSVPALHTTYEAVLGGQPRLSHGLEDPGVERMLAGLTLQYWKPGEAAFHLADAVRHHRGEPVRALADRLFQKDPDPDSGSGCATKCNISCLDGTSCSIDCNTASTGLCAKCKCDPFATCNCKAP